MPPSLQHWCGTDRLGRDVRALQGSGVALQVVLLAVAVALVIGVPLGMVGGYLGGAVDRVLVLHGHPLHFARAVRCRWCWPCCWAAASPMRQRRSA